MLLAFTNPHQPIVSKEPLSLEVVLAALGHINVVRTFTARPDNAMVRL